MKKLTLITLNRVPATAEGATQETEFCSPCSPKLCQPVIDPTCPPNLEP